MVATCVTSDATEFLLKPVSATPLTTPATADRFKKALLDKSDIRILLLINA
jgi:hypothetical protein